MSENSGMPRGLHGLYLNLQAAMITLPWLAMTLLRLSTPPGYYLLQVGSVFNVYFCPSIFSRVFENSEGIQ